MSKKRLEWLLLTQTILGMYPHSRAQRLSDQIMVELMVVPDDAIPDTPQEMYHAIHEYVTWASTGLDEDTAPTWYENDWIGSDW